MLSSLSPVVILRGSVISLLAKQDHKFENKRFFAFFQREKERTRNILPSFFQVLFIL